MNDGVIPGKEPLSDEELAKVLAGHPHEESGSFPPIDQELIDRVAEKILEVDHKDPFVTELLTRMAKLYAERNAVYKDNYKKVGEVMVALFPEGKTLKTAEDFNKWHLFELAIVKLTRYVNQYEGGHLDSLEDLIVYMAMVAGRDADNGLG